MQRPRRRPPSVAAATTPPESGRRPPSARCASPRTAGRAACRRGRRRGPGPGSTGSGGSLAITTSSLNLVAAILPPVYDCRVCRAGIVRLRPLVVSKIGTSCMVADSAVERLSQILKRYPNRFGVWRLDVLKDSQGLPVKANGFLGSTQACVGAGETA